MSSITNGTFLCKNVFAVPLHYSDPSDSRIPICYNKKKGECGTFFKLNENTFAILCFCDKVYSMAFFLRHSNVLVCCRILNKYFSTKFISFA